MIPNRLLWAVIIVGTCLCLRYVNSVVIYEPFESEYLCFRRMNLTHQFGCASPGEGVNYGVAYQINLHSVDKDLKQIIQYGTKNPYSVVMDSLLLERFDVFDALKRAGHDRVAGILILENANTDLKAFSSDRSCPNADSSYYINSTQHSFCRSQQWNKPTPDHLQGLVFVDFPFPIFYVKNQTQIQRIEEIINDISSEKTLAIELSSPMTAAQNSETCLRKGIMSSKGFSLTSELFCDPLSGYNVFQHNIHEENPSYLEIVVIAARQDSFSLFDRIAPGADSAYSSVIVLLSILELLYRSASIRTELENSPKKLMFTLFDGEAWDYIGSGRTVYELINNNLRLSSEYDFLDQKYSKDRRIGLNNISLVIELNQLANHNSNQLFLHSDDKAANTQMYLNTIQQISTNIADIKVSIADKSLPMPPGSSHSFLKKNQDKKGNFLYSTIMLTNHEREYTNKFYNSFQDNFTTTNQIISNQKQFTRISDLMAKSIYKIITGKDSKNDFPSANETLIGELLDCFLVNAKCQLFNRTKLNHHAQSRESFLHPPSSYVSIFYVHNELRESTFDFMNYLSLKNYVIPNSDDCINFGKKNHLYCQKKSVDICSCHSTYRLEANSPAVNLTTYEINFDLTNEYPVWTESKWQFSSVKFFIVPSTAYRFTIAGIGFFVLILSIFVNHLFNKHFCDFFYFIEQSH